jgi:hypothetical protein
MSCDDAEGYFRSLDPSAFPSFDAQKEEAEEIFTCTVDDLQKSLSFVEPFVGSSTSSDPEDQYRIAQFQGNTVLGTDSQVLAVFESSKINTDMKVGNEELKKVIRFLKKMEGSKELTVSESKDVYFIETEEEVLFGYTKPISEFPQTQSVPTSLIEDEVWEISRTSLLRAIKALTATADPDDEALNVVVEGSGEEGEMNLSMRDALDSHDSTIDLACDRLEGSGMRKEFKINHEFFSQALNLYTGTTIRAAYTDKYFKLYNEDEDGNVEVCLITLRVREL